MSDPEVPVPPALAPDLREALDGLLGDRGADGEDDALLDRVRARVMQAVRAEAAPNRTVRSGEEWVTVAPGVARKLLWASGDVRSCMFRFAPGARVEAHLHAVDEECVVLEGTVRIGDDIVLHAGDFHVGLRGTRHPVSSTDTGAVIYLRGVLEC